MCFQTISRPIKSAERVKTFKKRWRRLLKLWELLRIRDLGPGPLRPQLPTGSLAGDKICAGSPALQPEGAIVVDESVTSGGTYYELVAGAPLHSWLTLTGGAIGQGPPCATGAALAAPDRPVINLQADGSAMYTVQALWTQAKRIPQRYNIDMRQSQL